MKSKKPTYRLQPDGGFTVGNYNFSKPFASFFPGIAGKYGIPMWVFYVNRGQAIASFGIKDKDHSILEFFPANKSWQLAPFLGFRTFIKVRSKANDLFYEPFHNGFANAGFDLSNQLTITSYDLTLRERNSSLGLETDVNYFTVPNAAYAALVRTVTIRNTGRAVKKLQLLDGLPQIVPYGTANLFLKKLGRTIEAWMNVKNLDKNVPFYKLDVDPIDRPEVIHIKAGNFYLGFHFEGNTPKIIKPIVDPETIFGAALDFSCPYQFAINRNFAYPKQQLTKNKTPAGFSLLSIGLKPGEEKTFYCVIGYMRSLETLNAALPFLTKPGYLQQKSRENRKLIETLQEDIATRSGSSEFDLYAKQTYLDNIMRGGYPVVLKTESHDSVFYLYSRKHGDLERDYNKFQIQPTYFSQGNGNYRDVNQNRRCDGWFNPEIKDENIVTFFNLLQPDGYNPLVVKGLNFIIPRPEELFKALKGLMAEKDIAHFNGCADKPFTPGEAIFCLEEHNVRLKGSYDDFLTALLSVAVAHPEAEHGEGFWTDHWTYNLDLLENYLRLYPENAGEILFKKRCFTFFDPGEVVKPRSEKYFLKNGRVLQLHSVVSDREKIEMIRSRAVHPHTVRANNGTGDIYYTTLLNKLLCILANKVSSLDPFGCGIQMEADKPNWYDALNGLPALLGSSSCETFELKRLCLIVRELAERSGIDKFSVTEEILDFLAGLGKTIQSYLESGARDKDFRYWDEANSLKENYRLKVRFGFSGRESQIALPELISLLDKAIEKIDGGLRKAFAPRDHVYYSYFINEAAEYQNLNDDRVSITRFTQKKLPFFLEPQVHALRITRDIETARKLYQSVKKSPLYDKKLKMYKVNASLAGTPEELGRCRAFTPGWLENESVWLHMEYKYLLELLYCGLYEEFYADLKNVLIPFQDPGQYGRSILENSSFLVSSAFPDKRLHGNGFVARLSGSTAEFLNIWLAMSIGKTPFFLNDAGELNLKFRPVLASWLFTKKDNAYSFNFLSRIRVTYHNPGRKNTFGKNGSRPRKILFNDKDGNPIKISSDTIPAPYAEQVRSRLITRIDIHLS
jgi:hypothetical protein